MSVSISFEVFPPKHPDGLPALANTVTQLQAVDPVFVSVTYGAGGSDRQRSFEAIGTVRGTGAEVAGHLTCVGQPRHDIGNIVDRYVELGVRQVVALRGDPPGGVDAVYSPHPDGFQTTAELVVEIKNRSDLQVAVSAYPECHPQSPSCDHDLRILADKVAAGADRAMTQMFFDNELYLRVSRCRQGDRHRHRHRSGIFPIHSFPAVTGSASRCGASIPDHVAERFAGLDDDTETTRKIAAELAAEQIAALAAEGVEQVHVYTLNRSGWHSTSATCSGHEPHKRPHDDDQPGPDRCPRSNPGARRRQRQRIPDARADRDRTARRPIADHPSSLADNLDLLVLTQPDARPRPHQQIPAGGRRHHHHQHVLVDRRRPRRVRASINPS